ncbi:hypothetical protein CLU82_1255 [Flavobacterium sp. 5]|nr:hypothetical protein CLU82_1255 [Flavobacterium sp. 5]
MEGYFIDYKYNRVDLEPDSADLQSVPTIKINNYKNSTSKV